MKIKDLFEQGFDFNDINILFQNYNPDDELTLGMIEEIENNLDDIIDSIIDIYNSDLLEWVKQYDLDGGFIKQAVEEFGDSGDFYKNIQMGEWVYYDNLFHDLISDIKGILEYEEDENEGDE